MLKIKRVNVIAICLELFCSMALRLHVLFHVRSMPPYGRNAVGLWASRGSGPGRARSGARRARNGQRSLRSRVGLAMRLAQVLSELSAAAGDITSKCSLHSHSGERARCRSPKKWRARCRSHRGGLAVARVERGSGLASLAHGGGRARCRSHMGLRSEVKQRLAPHAVSPNKLPQQAPHHPRAHVWLQRGAEVDRSSLRSAWVSPCDVRT